MREHYRIASVATPLLGALLCHAAESVRSSEGAPVRPSQEYRDEMEGLSFEYPPTWVRGSPPEYLVPNIFLDENVSERSVYSRGGRTFQGTNLIGSSFSYLSLPAKDADACTRRAQQNHGDMSRLDTIDAHGVRLMHGSTSEGAACHRISQEVYWTYRNDRCFLFETDLASTCPDADVNERPLTRREYATLRDQLLRIVKSIRFAPR